MNSRRPLLPGPLAVRFLLWLALFAMQAALLSPSPASLAAISFNLEVLGRTTVLALPPRSVKTLGRTERVLEYLEKAEKKEIDPWYRDDIRIAWITTTWAQYGVPKWAWLKDSPPHVAATFQVLQRRPEEVWPHILRQRQEKLGALYEQVWGGQSSPRKPVQSVKSGAVFRKGRVA